MPKTISATNEGIQLTNSEDSELSLFGLNITTDYITIPSGNTAQRPNSPEAGMIRLNTETGYLEGYEGTEWVNIEP
jgi:hypothetical protein